MTHYECTLGVTIAKQYALLHFYLWTFGRSFQKWACIFTIFYAVVVLHSSN